MLKIELPLFRNRPGFTLLELLIVIGIVAVLSASTLFISINTNLQRARDGKRQADLETVRTALELYRSDKGGYPSTVFNGLPSFLVNAPNDYISDLPEDPKGNAYYYRALNCGATGCKSYELCAGLERQTTPVLCGVNCGVGINCSYKTTNP